EGLIPWDAISDVTRPVTVWRTYSDPQDFIRAESEIFLSGYARDLLQSQPNHLEIVGEKLSIEGILRPVAARYQIPYTVGRGFCSIDPRRRLAERFIDSKKAQLVVLILSDFDPDGQEIAHS